MNRARQALFSPCNRLYRAYKRAEHSKKIVARDTGRRGDVNREQSFPHVISISKFISGNMASPP